MGSIRRLKEKDMKEMEYDCSQNVLYIYIADRSPAFDLHWLECICIFANMFGTVNPSDIL